MTITADESTVSTLIDGSDSAGIQKDSASCELKLTGSGSLTAQGGKNGAGIGGGEAATAEGIVFVQSSVKVVAGEDANAIGGGYSKPAVLPKDK